MKLCFPANSATSVATTRPSNEKPSSVNMNRFAHVQPSPTAIPATMIAPQPRPNSQLLLPATVVPQLTSLGGWPTSPTVMSPGTTASVTTSTAANAIDRTPAHV